MRDYCMAHKNGQFFRGGGGKCIIWNFKGQFLSSLDISSFYKSKSKWTIDFSLKNPKKKKKYPEYICALKVVLATRCTDVRHVSRAMFVLRVHKNPKLCPGVTRNSKTRVSVDGPETKNKKKRRTPRCTRRPVVYVLCATFVCTYNDVIRQRGRFVRCKFVGGNGESRGRFGLQILCLFFFFLFYSIRLEELALILAI